MNLVELSDGDLRALKSKHLSVVYSVRKEMRRRGREKALKYKEIVVLGRDYYYGDLICEIVGVDVDAQGGILYRLNGLTGEYLQRSSKKVRLATEAEKMIFTLKGKRL